MWYLSCNSIQVGSPAYGPPAEWTGPYAGKDAGSGGGGGGGGRANWWSVVSVRPARCMTASDEGSLDLRTSTGASIW